MMNVRTFAGLFKEAGAEWIKDKVPRLGAALAFYSILSLAPLFVILLAIAGAVFGPEAARGQLDDQIQGMVGKEGAEAIQEMIRNAERPGAGIVASVLGVVTLLLGASGVFGQLQDAMNTIWEVTPKSGRGFWGIIRDRFLSFSMVLGFGFLLLVSLSLSAALTAMGEYFVGLLPDYVPVLKVANFAVSFLVIAVLFAMIFKILPDVKIAWSDVWVGAIMTAALFTIGKAAIGFYLGRSTVASSYGAVGSLVVLLLWIYYSTQILFFGAEFTQVYANRFGTRIEPDDNAVPVTETERMEEGIPHGTAPSARRAS